VHSRAEIFQIASFLNEIDLHAAPPVHALACVA
jgi:hypothetical protein